MLSVDSTKLPDLISRLDAAGIASELRSLDPVTGRAEYICHRGRASFSLGVFPDPVAGESIMMFTADRTGWRWWNFPLLWLVSIPFTPRELRLQRDADSILRSLGARPLSE
jgi:hypothetical protein